MMTTCCESGLRWPSVPGKSDPPGPGSSARRASPDGVDRQARDGRDREATEPRRAGRSAAGTGSDVGDSTADRPVPAPQLVVDVAPSASSALWKSERPSTSQRVAEER